MNKKSDNDAFKYLRLKFSSVSFGQLRQLKIATGLPNYAAVIQNALRLYQWIIQQKRLGHTVRIEVDGKIKDLKINL